MKRNLELKDIAGYLPYGLKVECNDGSGSVEPYKLTNNCILFNEKEFSLYGGVPFLRPLSDLNKTITHNRKEIVPIVELAKMCEPDLDWTLNKFFAHNEEYDGGFQYLKVLNGFYYDKRVIRTKNGKSYFAKGRFRQPIKNQYQLFEYMNELKIDYRGLIDAELAIDTDTLEINPYK